MFGKNIQMKQSDAPPSGTLHVREIFSTIQGEGPLSGTPATFVRLAGCNLKCHFCDTDFEFRGSKDIWIVECIVDECIKYKNELVVLTGGEPLMQDITPLILLLREHGMRVQIETAGTVWPASLTREVLYPAHPATLNTTIVVSPKTQQIHLMVEVYADAYKYLIDCSDTISAIGLPITNTQGENGAVHPLFVPSDFEHFKGMLFLQPVEVYVNLKPDSNLTTPFIDQRSTEANIQKAVDLCMKHGYRLSLQMHKLLGLR
jgi:organic radical activating enzyme